MKHFEKIESIIDNLRERLRYNEKPIRNTPKLVFICGENIIAEDGRLKAESELSNNKRFILKKKLEEREFIIPIIAESLYDFNGKHDALTFEHLLAALSHNIVIILESYGTVCELGAFSSNPELVDKIYVFNDIIFESENSFINTGPIRKIKEQDESRVGFVKFQDDDFSQLFEVRSYLNDISNLRVDISTHDGSENFKLIHFFFSVLSLVQLLGPVSEKEVSDFFKRLYGVAKYKICTANEFYIKTTTDILKLAEKMELIHKREIGGRFYYLTNVKYDFKNYIFEMSDNEFNLNRTAITNIYQKAGRL